MKRRDSVTVGIVAALGEDDARLATIASARTYCRRPSNVYAGRDGGQYTRT